MGYQSVQTYHHFFSVLILIILFFSAMVYCCMFTVWLLVLNVVLCNRLKKRNLSLKKAFWLHKKNEITMAKIIKHKNTD